MRAQGEGSKKTGMLSRSRRPSLITLCGLDMKMPLDSRSSMSPVFTCRPNRIPPVKPQEQHAAQTESRTGATPCTNEHGGGISTLVGGRGEWLGDEKTCWIRNLVSCVVVVGFRFDTTCLF